MGLSVSSWLLVLAFCLLSYGQNGANDNDPHATGYLPPTPEQERHLQETHPRIVKVWPNGLALARINDERKKKGLEPLPEKGIVPRGAEKAFTVGDGPVISAVPQGFVGLTALPGSADNSLLDAFPEIRTQGSIGSCTNFAVTYYQLTYTAGRDYGWHDNKNVSNNDTKFSPKWTYNMINGGADKGSWPWDAYHVLEKHGAARWAQFPYQTSKTDPKSYREWCRDGETWRDAISYRIWPYGFLPPPPTDADVDTWLASIKGLLAGGEVLTFATYVSGWQYTTIQDDKSTPDDNAFVRKPVAYWVSPNPANHMMTIVGYNDSIWTDINKNRKVDPGEKGALKIANSWGPGWMDFGFCWLAYDALRSQSAVAGGPSSGRQRAIAGKVFSISMYSSSATPYQPTLLAKFKLNHAKREQLCITLGVSFNGGLTWPTTWTPGALQNQGGAYAFDGTSVPCEGTFVFDFTDILPGTPTGYSYGLQVTDSDGVGSAEFLGYKLTDMLRGTASGGLLAPPRVVDNGWIIEGLLYPSDPESVPVAVASAQPASGRAPLTVKFDGVGSSGDIYAYVWNFGDGSSPVQVQAPSTFTTHTFSTAGTYTATLTVLDENWAESSNQVVVRVTGKK
jgi:hypothetical protein